MDLDINESSVSAMDVIEYDPQVSEMDGIEYEPQVSAMEVIEYDPQVSMIEVIPAPYLTENVTSIEKPKTQDVIVNSQIQFTEKLSEPTQVNVSDAHQTLTDDQPSSLEEIVQTSTEETDQKAKRKCYEQPIEKPDEQLEEKTDEPMKVEMVQPTVDETDQTSDHQPEEKENQRPVKKTNQPPEDKTSLEEIDQQLIEKTDLSDQSLLEKTNKSSLEKTVQTEPSVQRKGFSVKATQIFLPELDDQMDHSLLQPPLNLGVKNVRQILTCVQSGSLEVQDIIFNECNVIYECKVCRNLFRCLANLISHKRFYCKNSFSKFFEMSRKQAQTDFTVVVEPASPLDLGSEEVPDTSEEKLENPHEVTTIKISTPKIYMPTKSSRVFTRETASGEDQNNETFIHLENIEGNHNAFFQTVMETSDKAEESTMVSEKEYLETPNQEGKPSLSNSILMTREQKLMMCSDCNIKTLTCTKCDIHYLTLKSLYVHMMTMHAKKRVYYPCLYCKNTFAQMYGVGRHMMKAHNKNKEQFTRIRNLVKNRAFIRKGPFPPEQPEDKNDFETVLPPVYHQCSKCKREFARKSSQISHEKFCHVVTASQTSNSTAPAPAHPPIPTASVSTVNTIKATVSFKCPKCGREFKLKSSYINHMKFCKVKVENFKASPTSPPKVNIKVSPKINLKPIMPSTNIIYEVQERSRPKRDIKKKKMNTDFVSSQSLKWRSANKVETVSGSKVIVDQKSNNNDVIIGKSTLTTPKKAAILSSRGRTSHQEKLSSQPRPSAQVSQNRTSSQKLNQAQIDTTSQPKSPPTPKEISMNIIEGRVYTIINAQKLSCLKCNRRFSTFSNLRRHAATHIGWMRFKCRHCNYQCFNRSDCRSHIQRIHPGSYTSPSNMDKNIMKLSTGKLNVRRGDLMEAESKQKPISKLVPSHDKKPNPVPVTREALIVKPSEYVSPMVDKPVPPASAPSKSPPALPVKSSARKSMGGAQRPIKILAPSVLPAVPRKKTISPLESPVSPPKLTLQPSPQLSLRSKSSISPTGSSVKPNVPATTKPHVILLNPRKRVIQPDGTPTLVTRAGTYTKTVLFVSQKPSVKSKNGQSAVNESMTSSQLLDHQYT